jgi:hypothetical protein
MNIVAVFVTLIAISVMYWTWSHGRQLAREKFIRTYMFPPGLLEKFAKQQPQLALKDKHLVARALRQFFLAHLKSGRKFVSMPSQVVDDLWHEFILYTRHYQQFCSKAFGQFLHHTPAVVLSASRQDNTGLRRTWWYACLEENINPRTPTRLPLLFAIDSKLYIPHGFTYALDCTKKSKDGTSSPYCSGDFSSSSFDGSTDGFGDSVFSSSADGGGDSGGGGCGGGCGGD